MTQHEKIIDLCKDGQWHCGNEIRGLMIFSMHKRMVEIEGRKNKSQPVTGKYVFEDRKCEHGHSGVRDYRMTPSNRPPKVMPLFARENVSSIDWRD